MESRPIKILFLASNPSDAARLGLDKELREIQDRLDDKNKFELIQRSAVRPQDLLRKIVDNKPQIVHFAGHGMRTGELCLEDEQRNTHRLRPEALAALFKLVSEHVKCVVINTCFSQDQANAIAEHIPFVIGMRKAIGDKAAIEFATGFYTALETDQSIEKIEAAFELGRVAIQLAGIPAEDLTPVLIFGDPKVRFRSEVEQVTSKLRRTDAVSAKIFRKFLHEKGKHMQLSVEEAESIINEVFEQFNELKRNLQKYEQSLTEAIRAEFVEPSTDGLPFEEDTCDALRCYQKELGLQNEDVALIHAKIVSDPLWRTPEAYFDRGTIHQDLEEYRKAINYFEQAINLRPHYSGAYFERAICYHKLGDKRTAIEDLNRAIEINSDWQSRSLSTAYFERGLVYFSFHEQGRNLEYAEAAARDWTETIKLRPSYSVAYYNRALAYQDLDKKQEAIDNFTQAIEIDNDWGPSTNVAYTYYMRGLFHRLVGNDSISKQDFQQSANILNQKPEYQAPFAENMLNFLKVNYGLKLDNGKDKSQTY